MKEVKDWIRDYERTSAARTHLIGFSVKGAAYMARVDKLETLERWIKLDYKFNTDGARVYTLRLRLDSFGKAMLLNKGARKLGTEEQVFECLRNVDTLNDAIRKNRGNNLEAFVQLMIHQLSSVEEYKHNNVPYWEAGDINLFGEEVQVKADNGSFAELNEIGKRAGL